MPSLTSTLVALAFFLAAAVISDNPQPAGEQPLKQRCIGFFLPIADDTVTQELQTKDFEGPYGFCAGKDTTNTTYCRLASCSGGPSASGCKNITSAPEAEVITTSGPASSQTCALGYILSMPYQDPKDPKKTLQGKPMCLNGTGESTQCDSIDTESKNSTPIVCTECKSLPPRSGKKSETNTNTGTNDKSTTTTGNPPSTTKPKTQGTSPVGGGP